VNNKGRILKVVQPLSDAMQLLSREQFFISLFSNYTSYLGFCVFTAVVMRVTTVWDIAPCGCVWINVSEERFASIFRVANQSNKKPARYQELRSSETLVHTRTARRYIPESSTFYIFYRFSPVFGGGGVSFRLATAFFLRRLTQVVYLHSHNVQVTPLNLWAQYTLCPFKIMNDVRMRYI
jgi:hypothetical protein